MPYSQIAKNSNSQLIKDLLIEDYKHLRDSFWQNEKSGETRLNFFITLVTAVLGALVGFGSVDKTETYISNEGFNLVVIFTLSSLLIFGTITLFRILKRNKATDEYKRGMDEIRQRFKDYFDGYNTLEKYYPLGGNLFDSNEVKKKLNIRSFGGLAHIIVAINSLIFGFGVGYVLLNTNITYAIKDQFGFIVFIGIISFLLAQMYYLYFYENKYKSEFKKNEFTHAGGIVANLSNNIPKFLIITAKQRKEEWVLPKGHILKKEGHGEAALREVLEETGCITKILQPIGNVNYLDKNKKEEIKAKFYLMQLVDILSVLKKENEDRIMEWKTSEDAIELLTFPESKELLCKASFLLKNIQTQ